MSAADAHERWLEDAAAYSLSALEPGEAAEFEAHLEGCQRCRERLRWLAPAVAALPESVRTFHEQFVTAMDDDLNTARALGVVFDEVREINRLLDAGADAQAIADHHANFARLGGVLGVLRHPASSYLDAEKGRHVAGAGLDPEEIERLIAERAAARKAKDFKRGDAIRDELLARGVVLKDGAGGTTWSVVQS